MAQTILVTGASGYVAAHVLQVFLDAGFKVRGTVRSESSAQKVKAAYPKYQDALSFAIVPDMTASGAFDEAVKGVDGVIHTASPFILNAVDFDKELYAPALNGTLEVLKSVKAHNPSVKRVVITSSFASVLNYSAGLNPGYVYTEADWNPTTTQEATDAKDAVSAYLVSKKIAEKAAWDFVENEKPNFTLATLTPPMVYGPVLHYVPSMDKLNTSSADIYRLFNGAEKEVPGTGFYAYVDVRDLADAHLLAYTSEAAANQRYLIAGSSYTMQMLVDIIRAKFPDLLDTTPKGNTGEPLPDVYRLDTSKIQKELGLKFRTMEQTVVDSVNSLRALEKQLS